MAPKKKKKRPEAAQQLIDSLLDEKTPTQGVVVPVSFSRPAPVEDEFEQTSDIELSLDDESGQPPFDGTTPVVTQMNDQLPDVDAEISLGGIDLSKPRVTPTNDENDADFNGSLRDDYDEDGEPTMKIKVAHDKEPVRSGGTPPTLPPKEKKPVSSFAATEIRSGMNPLPDQPKPVFSSTAFVSADAALKQSESLRIAQNRLSELENEIERLRRENEKLASAGDTLRRRSDELISRAETLENRSLEAKRLHDEEKKVWQSQMQAKERENAEMRSRLEEVETRLESGFKKIRVRERELEHRLEIVKMESSTLIGSKDRMILELKRQVDQLNHESDQGKRKSQELFNQYKEKQETIRRVVRALRIALTILEGDEDAVVPLKKAD
jgi:hypothetical protein